MESLDRTKMHPENQAVQATKSSFEIPTVSEEMYVKTREALVKEGYTFFVNIESLSIGQLVADKATSQRFGYVNPSENMRAIVPPQMEVAINPRNLRILKSNYKSTDVQISMLGEEEAALKAKLPQEVRNFISIPMQSASVFAQLDDKYQKETGKLLFTDWFGRTDTDDQTVVFVGRDSPNGRLDIGGWDGDGGGVFVFAVPVVVLPRKLAS